jgi:hypothetical protein
LPTILITKSRQTSEKENYQGKKKITHNNNNNNKGINSPKDLLFNMNAHNNRASKHIRQMGLCST